MKRSIGMSAVKNAGGILSMQGIRGPIKAAPPAPALAPIPSPTKKLVDAPHAIRFLLKYMEHDNYVELEPGLRMELSLILYPLHKGGALGKLIKKEIKNLSPSQQAAVLRGMLEGRWAEFIMPPLPPAASVPKKGT